MPASTNPLSGYVTIDKPPGPTSHDVVATIRRLFKPTSGRVKVGHTGTLDPFASGLLIITIGSATRLAEYTSPWPKTYEAVITLGASSTTDDRTGELTPASQTQPTLAALEKILATFIGTQTQLPPTYAAIKVAGQKMYDYARRGETVERKPRPITIYSLELLDYTYPTFRIRVTCSTGTYIRALARDIGEKLHTGAYVTELRRTAIGQLKVSQAEQLKQLSNQSLTAVLRPMSELVRDLPAVTVSPENVAQLRQGRAIELSTALTVSQNIAIFDPDQQLIGIGTIKPETPILLFPTKVL